MLAVVPGLGHLYLGRHWRGLFVFAIFAIAVNGLYFARVANYPGTGIYVLSLCRVAGAAMWSYSLLHVAHLSGRFERRRVAERKDYHFKRGLARYLAGSFDAARSEFLTVLRLDPMDVDARFHLAMTQKALGRRRETARALKRCLADDLDAKWRWEINSELDKLDQAGQGRGRG